MHDPCAFSSGSRQATRLAEFYAAMFPVGATVIDVGFGQGHFLAAARRRGLRAVGLDRDPRLVAEARDRGFEAVAADVRELPSVFAERVHGVMASHLIEHLSPTDVSTLLSDLAATVVPGGSAVLATPNLRDWRVASDWFWRDPTHVRPYPPGAVQQLLQPHEWLWDAEGYEPMVVTRKTPIEWANRLRFGWDYGHPGKWYRLRTPG